MRQLTRKEFLALLARSAAVAAAIPALAACGGGGDDDGQGTPDAGPGCSDTISGNHGHVLTVTLAEVEAGNEKTYDIDGTAGHSHSVTLTAAHFEMLAAGDSVTVESTSSGTHSHDITVMCTF